MADSITDIIIKHDIDPKTRCTVKCDRGHYTDVTFEELLEWTPVGIALDYISDSLNGQPGMPYDRCPGCPETEPDMDFDPENHLV